VTKLDDWLQREANEHVRPEIRALVQRGRVTSAEVAALRCNSWEWEALLPAMTDEAFEARVEHCLKNCSPARSPAGSYDEAAYAVYLPELLKRLKRARAAATAFGDTLDAIREVLGQASTHYLVMAGDVMELVKAIDECESDSGCRATKVLRQLRESA
jgi:hypothetical protein